MAYRCHCVHALGLTDSWGIPIGLATTFGGASATDSDCSCVEDAGGEYSNLDACRNSNPDYWAAYQCVPGLGGGDGGGGGGGESPGYNCDPIWGHLGECVEAHDGAPQFESLQVCRETCAWDIPGAGPDPLSGEWACDFMGGTGCYESPYGNYGSKESCEKDCGGGGGTEPSDCGDKFGDLSCGCDKYLIGEMFGETIGPITTEEGPAIGLYGNKKIQKGKTYVLEILTDGVDKFNHQNHWWRVDFIKDNNPAFNIKECYSLNGDCTPGDPTGDPDPPIGEPDPDPDPPTPPPPDPPEGDEWGWVCKITGAGGGLAEGDMIQAGPCHNGCECDFINVSKHYRDHGDWPQIPQVYYTKDACESPHFGRCYREVPEVFRLYCRSAEEGPDPNNTECTPWYDPSMGINVQGYCCNERYQITPKEERWNGDEHDGVCTPEPRSCYPDYNCDQCYQFQLTDVVMGTGGGGSGIVWNYPLRGDDGKILDPAPPQGTWGIPRYDEDGNPVMAWTCAYENSQFWGGVGLGKEIIDRHTDDPTSPWSKAAFGPRYMNGLYESSGWQTKEECEKGGIKYGPMGSEDNPSPDPRWPVLPPDMWGLTNSSCAWCPLEHSGPCCKPLDAPPALPMVEGADLLQQYVAPHSTDPSAIGEHTHLFAEAQWYGSETLLPQEDPENSPTEAPAVTFVENELGTLFEFADFEQEQFDMRHPSYAAAVNVDTTLLAWPVKVLKYIAPKGTTGLDGDGKFVGGVKGDGKGETQQKYSFLGFYDASKPYNNRLAMSNQPPPINWYCGPQTYKTHRGIDIGAYGYGEINGESNYFYPQAQIIAAQDGYVQKVTDGNDYKCHCKGKAPLGSAWKISNAGVKGECGPISQSAWPKALFIPDNTVLIRHIKPLPPGVPFKNQAWNPGEEDISKHYKYTVYAHMRKGILVKEGQYVKKGDVLGWMGSSGISCGPHLHFEVSPRHLGKHLHTGKYVTAKWEAVDPFLSTCGTYGVSNTVKSLWENQCDLPIYYGHDHVQWKYFPGMIGNRPDEFPHKNKTGC